MSELNTLYPELTTATVAGVTAEIYPIKLRNAQLFAGMAGEMTAVLADASPLEAAAFCAKNETVIHRLLSSQTSLTDEQLKELSTGSAISWLYHLAWESARDFSHALSVAAATTPDGATSISGL